MNQIIHQSGTGSETYEGDLHPDAVLITEGEDGREYEVGPVFIIDGLDDYVPPIDPDDQEPGSDEDEPAAKISPTMILIGGGILLALGVAIYFITKK
jgi:hypothetical protein